MEPVCARTIPGTLGVGDLGAAGVDLAGDCAEGDRDGGFAQW
jgi:hypothetical protein